MNSGSGNVILCRWRSDGVVIDEGVRELTVCADACARRLGALLRVHLGRLAEPLLVDWVGEVCAGRVRERRGGAGGDGIRVRRPRPDVAHVVVRGMDLGDRSVILPGLCFSLMRGVDDGLRNPITGISGDCRALCAHEGQVEMGMTRGRVARIRTWVVLVA